MSNNYILIKIDKLKKKYDKENLNGMMYGPEEVLADLKKIELTAKFVDFYNGVDKDLRNVINTLLSYKECKNLSINNAEFHPESCIYSTLDCLRMTKDISVSEYDLLLEYFMD